MPKCRSMVRAMGANVRVLPGLRSKVKTANSDLRADRGRISKQCASSLIKTVTANWTKPSARPCAKLLAGSSGADVRGVSLQEKTALPNKPKANGRVVAAVNRVRNRRVKKDRVRGGNLLSERRGID